jgi:hypothetical protein
MLALARAVILVSESRWTHQYILLSQIRDSPNLERQILVFISHRNRVTQLYPPALIAPTLLIITSRQGSRRKRRSSVVLQSFSWEHICLPNRYSATSPVYLLISRSLPSNGCTCYNTLFRNTKLYILPTFYGALKFITQFTRALHWSPS